jgi:hypothetical protein
MKWSGVHTVYIVHLEAKWRPGEFQVDFDSNLAGLPAKIIHLESTWSPQVHLTLPGIYGRV